MCNKNPESLQLSSVIKKEISQTFEPIRKIRTKRRKPEFLSLRVTLGLEINRESDKMATATTLHHPHHQLNLFPLHPEHLVDEKDAHYVNLESFFAAADGGAATITSLLSGAVTSSEEDTSRASPSLTNTLVGLDGEEVKLVRTALRHKERDASEEKWVSYSEVVERKNEEVTSRAANPPMPCKKQRQGLSLKLDYQKILNAWSDKGPLYVQSEPPQTVPVLPDDFLSDHYSNGLMDVIESDGGLWTVPKKCCSNGSTSKGKLKVKEEVQGGAEWKMGQREASVLRYKEKKQNRLFSKKIRYQVRKLNAEKRPRVMGRFVKSS